MTRKVREGVVSFGERGRCGLASNQGSRDYDSRDHVITELLYFLLTKKTDSCLIAFTIYKLKDVFLWVVGRLVPSVFSWLLQCNNINI